MITHNYTIQEASKLIAKRKIKVYEIVKAYIDKAKKLNHQFNSFLTISEETALMKAKKVDQLIADHQKLGPLAGISLAVKDLFSTKGIRTTAGSRVLENYVPVYDATVISRLNNAYTITIGKTNLDAWGHGASGENSDFGLTKNPYDLSRVSGGSSSGSAVAVATGASLAATGTDTGGSIRLPSTFCNLVGLKPTYGRVSRYGVISMASSLDTVGHITKTVFDNALVLNVTAGFDFFDSTTSQKPTDDYVSDIDKGVKGLKIGIPREYFQSLNSEIKGKILSAVKILEKFGAKVIDVSLPHTEYGVAVYYVIQTSEVSSNLARYDGIRFGFDRSKFGAEAKRRIILGTFALSAGYYDAFYLKAMKVRRLIRGDFLNAFKKIDVLICPVSPTPAFKIGEKKNDPISMYLSDIFTVNANLAGIPSLAVPCGFVKNSNNGSDPGLPVGMQIIGPDFSEKMLYQVGFAYEQETKWYEYKPNL